MSGTGGFSNPTLHQTYIALPKLDAPLIDEKGNCSIIWYRLFISFWQILGGSKVSIPTAQVLQNVNGQTTIINSNTGLPVGGVVPSNPAPVVITQTGTIPITSSQASVIWNPSGAVIPASTMTLPLSPMDGEVHSFKNLSTIALTIQGNIEGNSYVVLANQSDGVTVKWSQTLGLWIIVR